VVPMTKTTAPVQGRFTTADFRTYTLVKVYGPGRFTEASGHTYKLCRVWSK
jgi:hypothetical protein